MTNTTKAAKTSQDNKDDPSKLPAQPEQQNQEGSAPPVDTGSTNQQQDESLTQGDQVARVDEVIDMSLEARMSRAKDALDDAIDAQNQINAIVYARNKELDALIEEESASGTKNAMSDIQFYLTRQQRKRQEKAEKRRQMLEHGLDPLELIKQLDPRAPVDQRPASRKVHPLSMPKAPNAG